MTYKRKPTGELALFQEIWNERPHVSQVSGTKLGEFNVGYFAHLLPKSGYKKWRLNKDNILLMTLAEHTEFDHYRHKIKFNPSWEPILSKVEVMKAEYNRLPIKD